jgi:ribosome-associated translation inhibitor RaiA
MTHPLQITFRNLKHSTEVEDWIRAEAEKLETFYDRIIACRVAVEVPHRHHQKGKPLHVRIDLNLPGREIVVKREPVVLRRSPVNGNSLAVKRMPARGSHSDLQLVIHDAFKAAGRRLQDFARRRQGHVKTHEQVA